MFEKFQDLVLFHAPIVHRFQVRDRVQRNVLVFKVCPSNNNRILQLFLNVYYVILFQQGLFVMLLLRSAWLFLSAPILAI